MIPSVFASAVPIATQQGSSSSSSTSQSAPSSSVTSASAPTSTTTAAAAASSASSYTSHSLGPTSSSSSQTQPRPTSTLFSTGTRSYDSLYSDLPPHTTTPNTLQDPDTHSTSMPTSTQAPTRPTHIQPWMLDVRNQAAPPLIHSNSDPTNYVYSEHVVEGMQESGGRATSQPLPEHGIRDEQGLR